MAKFNVLDLALNKVDEIELADEVFGRSVNPHLVYEVAKMQHVSGRRGTVMVKNSSLVSGGGKKPWKQKGTGRARQGSTRASHWVGGGKAMGPKPRDYFYRPPRAVRRQALCVGISQRAKEDRLLIVKDFPATGKTKEAVAALCGGLKLSDALVIDEKANAKLHLAIRNLESFDVLPPEGLNLRSLLKRKALVLTVAAARALEGSLKRERGTPAAPAREG